MQYKGLHTSYTTSGSSAKPLGGAMKMCQLTPSTSLSAWMKAWVMSHVCSLRSRAEATEMIDLRLAAVAWVALDVVMEPGSKDAVVGCQVSAVPLLEASL
eukprot:3940700-Rhodomonas_salina.2